jgi:hypothetical protein
LIFFILHYVFSHNEKISKSLSKSGISEIKYAKNALY